LNDRFTEAPMAGLSRELSFGAIEQQPTRRKSRLLRDVWAMFDAFAGFLFEVVFYYLFYWPSWLVLRILTLGKYPPALPEKHNQMLVSGMPTVLLAISIGAYYT
jgi:hypothetical protein